MSKNTISNKTNTQRSEAAIDRLFTEGRKLHGATPGTIEHRKQEVLRNFSILEGNRLPSTRKPLRTRSHNKVNVESGETQRRMSKKGIAIAGALTVAAAAYGIGQVASDTDYVPPSPANMVEFNSDPLQEKYTENPDQFKVQGGMIVEQVDSQQRLDIDN